MNINDVGGFTLIELVITLAVAATLTLVGIPSFTETIKTNRLTTYNNDFVASLNLARSEAIKRNASVTVRKVDNNSFTKVSATANWEDGWDVFTDADSDGNFEAGDTLIKTYPPLPASFTLRGNANVANYIRYTTSGRANTNGSFVFCDNSEVSTSKVIVVISTGRTRAGSSLGTCTP